ncbi:MAG: PRC-barrel domain-containing protein [Ilumatobacteraceae bacterium]
MSVTFSDADARTVVSGDTAETLGEVRGFVVDRTGRQIEAVHIAKRGRRSELVPWSAITSFGDDAVVVSSADQVHRVEDDRELEAVRGHITVRGSRVLDADGFERGEVRDAMFGADGRLTGILTDDGRIAADRILALGSYALVIRAN